MENKNGQEFYTEAHLSKCIEIPINTVTEGLNKFLEFKGLLTENIESTPFYVDGYLIIDEARVTQTSEDDYEEILIKAKCSKYCSRPELENNSYIVSMPFLIEEAFISYSEFKIALNKFGIPLINEVGNVNAKNFSYDVSLVNRKSNFTLNDAAKIAANIYSIDHNDTISQLPNPLKNHYLELLSDCIKGTNQDDFKLHTLELWCSYYEEFGERYSKTYENGTYLKQKAILDYQLTIISKKEFVRWCEYENINTGLTCEPRYFDDSIEALKAENDKLKEQQRSQQQLPPKQLPPSVLDKNNYEKIEQLNTKIKTLTDEVELLKGNSFSVMTLKLKAILATQNEYWISYDNKNLPTQQEISNFIAEKLNLTVTAKGTNRTADELAKAIQPDEIKRK
jgi:FtsZ-binding cell division protein ZapB